MRILVLGGDGFLGWPTSLRLSAAGHDVAVVDDFARRGADAELQIDSVTPIGSLNDRVAAWSRTIGVHPLDVATDFDELRSLLASVRPDAVVHLAQQRSAAYSMRGPTHRRYTVDNNVSATHNLLAALAVTGVDAHVVAVLAGGGPGSVADVTGTLSRELLGFAARVDGLRVTDVRGGIVWGTQTVETAADERLLNRFDYDGDFGTVLNRFLVQAAVGHPLQVHGAGDAVRGFVHLHDLVRAIVAALADPPPPGSALRTMCAVTETHRIRDLADVVAALTGAEIAHVDDPRPIAEAAAVAEPAHAVAGPRDGASVRMAETSLFEVVELARRYRDRIDTRRIPSATRWAGTTDVLATA